MERGSSRWVSLGIMVLAAGLLGGCCSSEMKPYNVTVSLSPAFTNKPAVEVHLVGVSDAENPMWSQYSMTKYWQDANNPLRQTSNKYVMRFGPGQPDAQTLSKTDPIWAKWQGATRLYVLAFLPGRFDDAPEDRDPRRRILPLDHCRWAKKDQQEIKVTLLPSNVMVETPPLAEKK